MKSNLIFFRIQLGVMIIFLLLPLFSAEAKYRQYTYQNSDDDYHLTDLELSQNGDFIVGIGENDTDEVIVFVPQHKTPQWRYAVGEEEKIFDSAISSDGSTIVACGTDVWLLDTASQSLLWKNDAGAYSWDVCALSADGSIIVAGNRGGSVALWEKESSTIVREWAIAEAGYFVNSVSLTKNGNKLLVSTDFNYSLINTSSDDFLWNKTSETEIISSGLASKDGQIGFLIREDEELSSGEYTISGINKKGKISWTKSFSSFNTPYARISANGQRLVLSTNDLYYGIKADTGKVKWQFERGGGETFLGMSNNGKYIAISEGHDYVYLYDWDFPRDKQRPFKVEQASFPDNASLSGNGSTLAYVHDDFTLKQVKPGILAKVHGIPIYRPDDEVQIDYFVTSPGKNENLKIRTTLSLPQISILSDFGVTVSGEPQSVKGKLLDYANKTIPGYEVADERSLSLEAQHSKNLKTNFTMPGMILPDWLGDLLELLGVDDFFENLLGEYADPVKDLVNDEINDAWMSQSRDAYLAGEVAYAFVGLGQVELYDAQTNETYSNDYFFFMYLAL